MRLEGSGKKTYPYLYPLCCKANYDSESRKRKVGENFIIFLKIDLIPTLNLEELINY